MSKKLHFRHSAMNAGKSIQLLQIAHNYEQQGQRVQVFTDKADTRFGEGVVASRLGPQRPAILFDRDFDFTTAVRDVACVLVDEAQFLTAKQVRDLHIITKTRDIPVICFGLRTDFLGNPFEGAAYLLALAESIEEIKTTCQCGGKATMNIRVDSHGVRVEEGPQKEIGDASYRSVCGRCFYLPRALAAHAAAAMAEQPA